VESFPNLSIDNLFLYAYGSYQVKMAKNYYGDHANKNGEVIVERCYRQYNINADANDSIDTSTNARNYSFPLSSIFKISYMNTFYGVALYHLNIWKYTMFMLNF